MAEDRSQWTVEQWAEYAKGLEAKLPPDPVEAFRARKVYQLDKLKTKVAALQAQITQYADELARAPEIVAALEAARRSTGGSGNVVIGVPPAVLDLTGN